MKFFNKGIRICALLLALIFLLSGCGKDAEPSENTVLSIYASCFPLYALAQAVVGDAENIRLNCLIQPQDGCFRSYQLSDWDLSLLTRSAGAVIAGGRGLESFESLLYALGENGPAVATIFNDMQLDEFYAVNVQTDESSHWTSENPHIYMKIGSGAEIAERIASVISILDAENEHIYAENLDMIKNRLKSVENDIKNSLSDLSGTPVIVMNEALAYVAQDFGLEIELCYGRESGEEMDAQQLESCIKMLKSCKSRLILIEKQAPQSLVAALHEAGYELACMDTMSTRRASEGFEGYLNSIQENAQALIDAATAANSAS